MDAGGQKQRPVVIVRKKVAHGGHHGGAWKVAFADFVTAMMALFLVLWIVGQKEEVKNAIGGYFRDPTGFQEKVGMGLLDGPVLSESQQPAAPAEVPPAESGRRELERTASEIVDALLRLPGLSKLGEEIEVELTEEGLRIQLVESAESTFFAVGGVELSPRGRQVLSTIAGVLGPVQNRVVVEGHTDNRQYADRRYTNWELSADRANKARSTLEAGGLDSRRIAAVRAYADSRPRKGRGPEDPRNRRIAIVVLDRAQQVPIDLSDREAPGEG